MYNRNILLDPAYGDTTILWNVSNCLPSQHSLMSLKTWIFILNLRAKWKWLASHTPWTAFCNHQLGSHVGSKAGFEMPVKKKIMQSVLWFWSLSHWHLLLRLLLSCNFSGMADFIHKDSNQIVTFQLLNQQADTNRECVQDTYVT